MGSDIELVRQFNRELSSIYETKPPISKAKMAAITRYAVKALKYYKHIVHSVEKFLHKCREEYKIAGLYVLDSIIRQSRHQFGAEKDLFGPRFKRNIKLIFQHIYQCPAEDKPKVVRVLNLWQKNEIFSPDVISPLIDMASTPAKVLKASIHRHKKAKAAFERSRKNEASLEHSFQDDMGGDDYDNDDFEAPPPISYSEVSSSDAKKKRKAAKMSQEDEIQVLKAQLEQQRKQQELLQQQLQMQMMATKQQALQSQLAQQTMGSKLGSDVSALVSMLPMGLQSQQSMLNPTANLMNQIQELTAQLEQDKAALAELSTKEPKPQIPAPGPLIPTASDSKQSEFLENFQQLLQTAKGIIQKDPRQQHADKNETTNMVPPQPSEQFPSDTQSSTYPLQQGGSQFADSNQQFKDKQRSRNDFEKRWNEGEGYDQPPPNKKAHHDMFSRGTPPPQPPPPERSSLDSRFDEEAYVAGAEDMMIDNDDLYDPTEAFEMPSESEPLPIIPDVRENPPPPFPPNDELQKRPPPFDSHRDSRDSRQHSRQPQDPRSDLQNQNRNKFNRHEQQHQNEKDAIDMNIEEDVDAVHQKQKDKSTLPPPLGKRVTVASLTLWVGRLPKNSGEMLHRLFSDFGKIKTIDHIEMRGCAFVTMATRYDADSALRHLKHKKFLGHDIKLAWGQAKCLQEFSAYWDDNYGCAFIPWNVITDEHLIDIVDDCIVDEASLPPNMKLPSHSFSKESSTRERESVENSTSSAPQVMPPMPPPFMAGLPPPGMLPPNFRPPFPPLIPPGMPGMLPLGFRPPLGPMGGPLPNMNPGRNFNQRENDVKPSINDPRIRNQELFSLPNQRFDHRFQSQNENVRNQAPVHHQLPPGIQQIRGESIHNHRFTRPDVHQLEGNDPMMHFEQPFRSGVFDRPLRPMQQQHMRFPRPNIDIHGNGPRPNFPNIPKLMPEVVSIEHKPNDHNDFENIEPPEKNIQDIGRNPKLGLSNLLQKMREGDMQSLVTQPVESEETKLMEISQRNQTPPWLVNQNKEQVEAEEKPSHHQFREEKNLDEKMMDADRSVREDSRGRNDDQNERKSDRQISRRDDKYDRDERLDRHDDRHERRDDRQDRRDDRNNRRDDRQGRREDKYDRREDRRVERHDRRDDRYDRRNDRYDRSEDQNDRRDDKSEKRGERSDSDRYERRNDRDSKWRERRAGKSYREEKRDERERGRRSYDRSTDRFGRDREVQEEEHERHRSRSREQKFQDSQGQKRENSLSEIITENPPMPQDVTNEQMPAPPPTDVLGKLSHDDNNSTQRIDLPKDDAQPEQSKLNEDGVQFEISNKEEAIFQDCDDNSNASSAENIPSQTENNLRTEVAEKTHSKLEEVPQREDVNSEEKLLPGEEQFNLQKMHVQETSSETSEVFPPDSSSAVDYKSLIEVADHPMDTQNIPKDIEHVDDQMIEGNSINDSYVQPLYTESNDLLSQKVNTIEQSTEADSVSTDTENITSVENVNQENLADYSEASVEKTRNNTEDVTTTVDSNTDCPHKVSADSEQQSEINSTVEAIGTQSAEATYNVEIGQNSDLPSSEFKDSLAESESSISEAPSDEVEDVLPDTTSENKTEDEKPMD